MVPIQYEGNHPLIYSNSQRVREQIKTLFALHVFLTPFKSFSETIIKTMKHYSIQTTIQTLYYRALLIFFV